MMNAATSIQARTTSQMIVERLRAAGLLFWLWKLKGEASEVGGNATMVSSALVPSPGDGVPGKLRKKYVCLVKTSFRVLSTLRAFTLIAVGRGGMYRL